jgi:hypothetical protein
MTATAKHPTPQGISALLKRAYYVRGVPKMRGGVSGYRVRQGAPGEVLVNRYSSLMGASREQELLLLDGYARVIRGAGYNVTLDDRTRWLVVTANIT